MTTMPECEAEADAYSDGYIRCDLPAGHKGLHYDSLHDVSWKTGKPG